MPTSWLRHPDGTLCRRDVMGIVLGVLMLCVAAAGGAGYLSGYLYAVLLIAPIAVHLVVPSCPKHKKQSRRRDVRADTL